MENHGREPSPRPKVIFLRGITQRCGTNYVRDLIASHRSVVHAQQVIWEDFSLDDAGQLDRYVTMLGRRWPDHWDVPLEDVRARLLREFGDGLVRSIIVNSDRPEVIPVAKTPTVAGLEYFDALFPDDPLVLLVRDGRSTVESLMRSFGQSFDRAVHDWADGADRIIRFREQHRDTEGVRWVLLRYEDVVADVAAEMQKVIELAGLDMAAYNLTKATSLPVRGSSSFGRTDGAVTWERVAKDDSFDPLGRSAEWDAERHRRFNWVAQEQMTALGYDLDGPPADFAASLRYRSRDLAHSTDTLVRGAVRRWRQRPRPL